MEWKVLEVCCVSSSKAVWRLSFTGSVTLLYLLETCSEDLCAVRFFQTLHHLPLKPNPSLIPHHYPYSFYQHMLITKHYSLPQTEWLAEVTMHYDTRVLVETYPWPLSVCVHCFDVEEKWFDFTPYMWGEARPSGDGEDLENETHSMHSLTPTISYRCEFEHRVKGASQIRQLVCGGRGKLRLWRGLVILKWHVTSRNTAADEPGFLYLQVCPGSRPAGSAL